MSGLRIRVAVVGSTSCCRIRVDTSVEEGAARLQLVADAAAKLDVVMPQGGAGDVMIYTEDGAPLDECAMLDKDDTLYLAFDGGPWREPHESSAGSGSTGDGSSGGSSVAGDCSKEPMPTATGLAQRSIGSFMGQGTKRKFVKDDFGRRVEVSGEPPLRVTRTAKFFAPAARSFRNWPASSSYLHF